MFLNKYFDLLQIYCFQVNNIDASLSSCTFSNYYFNKSRADVGYGWVAPKPCGRNKTKAEALPCQSRADNGYGWVAPKPCTNERTGQEAEAKMGVILALRR